MPSRRAGEWPIGCSYFNPRDRNFAEARVWARTPDGAAIHATGNVEGGFLVADAIFYSSGVKSGHHWLNAQGSEPMPEIRTMENLKELCQNSIDRYTGKPGRFRLIKMTASTSHQLGAAIYPIVYGEEQNDDITRIVLFGDSTTDVGLLFKTVGKLMPASPNWSGRFADGLTWSEYLALFLNAATLNYSTGGAVTRANITSAPSSIIKYVKEMGRYFVTGSVRNFIDDYRKNALHKSAIPAVDKTLFVLWAGANDFLSKFDRKSEINALVDNPDTPAVGGNSIREQTVMNLGQEIKGLIGMGVKKLLVINLPDIGTTPRMAETSLYRSSSPEDKYVFAEKNKSTLN